MASITIRNLDDSLKQRLRARAGANDRSLEEEVCHILREAVSPGVSSGIGSRIHARFADVSVVDPGTASPNKMRRPVDLG